MTLILQRRRYRDVRSGYVHFASQQRFSHPLTSQLTKTVCANGRGPDATDGNYGRHCLGEDRVRERSHAEEAWLQTFGAFSCKEDRQP